MLIDSDHFPTVQGNSAFGIALVPRTAIGDAFARVAAPPPPSLFYVSHGLRVTDVAEHKRSCGHNYPSPVFLIYVRITPQPCPINKNRPSTGENSRQIQLLRVDWWPAKRRPGWLHADDSGSNGGTESL
jgi:hypothetical protein